MIKKIYWENPIIIRSLLRKKLSWSKSVSFILKYPVEKFSFSRVARLAASYIFQAPLFDAFRILGFERQSEHIAIDRHLDARRDSDGLRASVVGKIDAKYRVSDREISHSV